MPTLQTVLAELKSRGSEKTRITYNRHGIPLERSFGVSVADLKVVAKPLKRQQTLAMQLYESGVFEAMYLAGILADGAPMTEMQLQSWAEGTSDMSMIAEYSVPWVTVENAAAIELAEAWIHSPEEYIRSSGWCTFSGLAATKPDESIDLAKYEGLLNHVVRNIDKASGRARYTMNGFVIAVGTYILPLLEKAKAAAIQIGTVSVDMGDTACRVPLASEYIAKMEGMKRVGQKRKTIRC